MKKIIISLLFFSWAQCVPYQAVIIAPVADLAGQSLNELSKTSASWTYKNLTICGKKGEFACPRIHQALFQEQVTVMQEVGDEVLIRIPNYFFETERDHIKHDTFWTLKKNIMPFDHLKKHGINLAHLPNPISYQGQEKSQQNIVTLLDPYKDTKTGNHFSVGTRFVLSHYNEVTASVYCLDPKNTHIQIIELPKKYVIQTSLLSPQQKITLFVRLCKKWANTKNGFIPYVWGGCSFTSVCSHDAFSLHEAKDHRGNPISFFKRLDARHPHGGFDCAGLIARAAQTAGLPYYFKNTTTLAKHLAQHTKESALQPGDLIWFSGHVMILGNTKKNTVIEARHYSHGYGKVHEIPIQEVFKGISSFDQLKAAYLENKPLQRMDKSQNVIQTINNFKLLQMTSIFPKNLIRK